ncbi:MAG TPA: lysophospholipid acyltransferase family protein [Burkholderiales bacterium]|nr:lysophospholipid acyltransferase family protein [Burkholderiales bacterium]
MSARALAGSVAFALFQLLVTPPWAVVSLLSFPLPPLARYRVISAWSRTMVWGARAFCGIDYLVKGAENIPPEPCVILAKHESAWETLALQAIFPPQVWVVKRELLWIPFFGWGLAMLSPIAIDRRAGRRALRQMIDQGRERLKRGFSIVIFPEGTRVAPGQRGEYQAGGAWLALQTGAAIVPVAHNAGSFWPRKAFIKRPGTITVSIGAAVHPTGVKAAALMHNIEQWIENETARIRAAS